MTRVALLALLCAHPAAAQATREECLELFTDALELEAAARHTVTEMLESVTNAGEGSGAVERGDDEAAQAELQPVVEELLRLEQEVAASWEAINAALGDACRDKF
jgi:hypothetical protein